MARRSRTSPHPLASRARAAVRLYAVAVAALLVVAACGGASTPPPTASGAPTQPPPSAAATSFVPGTTVLPPSTATPAVVSPSSTPSVGPSASASVPRSAYCGTPPAPTPSPAGRSAGLTLVNDPSAGIDAQVELSVTSGRRVLIDVGYPDGLTKPAEANDILLTTHDHQDHLDPAFRDAFPGRVVPEGGSVSLSDVNIAGINAAHGTTEAPATGPDGSDYLYVVEMGGLRIAHFGDLGQTALTKAQLDALGRVDVAISQFDNPYSSVTAENRIGYDLMQQVCPRVIIPTHMLTDDVADMRIATSLWKAEYTPNPSVHIQPSTLPTETTVLLMGYRGSTLGPLLNLPKSPW